MQKIPAMTDMDKSILRLSMLKIKEQNIPVSDKKSIIVIDCLPRGGFVAVIQ